ncbi:hypothetical protein N781_17945 [Pontibacillus halophilus JSM 076056 = DSM 19796]|uniref:Uncharacterized protein n=1 Tax=Pontibacillus halophilus JSM 076056 = DSM 19796 TaxID=1385510 RepID=A0A0A5I8W9_9BACI|nr:DUF5359 family protein [Pontibacillus halophilus]KGX92287.1 hypothetical protein N781_17945 [Pontibacillus halophilus JSM 076056 = DSM 19796]
MRRIETWAFGLIMLHGVLLLSVQVLLTHTDFLKQMHPVTKYFGVFYEEPNKIQETIDRLISFVL